MDNSNFLSDEELSCFKAYDVRGEIGKNINKKIVYRIARAFALVIKAKEVVVGHDCRLSSPELARSAIKGLIDQGVNVYDIGLCGTEEVYWATTEFKLSGGIMITASHNPINYNGMKFVKKSSIPISPHKDFIKIKEKSASENFIYNGLPGLVLDKAKEAKESYTKKILTFFDINVVRKLNIVVNFGNGAAGPTFEKIQEKIEKYSSLLNFIKMFEEPDGRFPNGVPNPMIEKSNKNTHDTILKNKADFGIAFDGDFDRCFFFDEKGKKISGEYIIGLLAEIFLEKEKRPKIVQDCRLIWNVEDKVKKEGGSLIVSKTGHSFIKEKMRNENAVYGGEISAHHYFKDFAFCDSGMIPWILLIGVLQNSKRTLSELVEERKNAFPSSGELNFRVKNPNEVLNRINTFYSPLALCTSSLDGKSFVFEDWRFNVRLSNTEPLLRLNVESKGDKKKLDQKQKVLSSLISE